MLTATKRYTTAADILVVVRIYPTHFRDCLTTTTYYCKLIHVKLDAYNLRISFQPNPRCAPAYIFWAYIWFEGTQFIAQSSPPVVVGGYLAVVRACSRVFKTNGNVRRVLVTYV